jgi:hypothetical protein
MSTIGILLRVGLLFGLSHLPGPGSGDAHSVAPAGDPRASELPVSVSVPILYAWSEDALGIGSTLGLTGTHQIVNNLDVGISFRGWWAISGPDRCELTQGDCRIKRQTIGLAYLAHADWYPSRNQLIFLRGGLGVSLIYEQEADWFYMYHSHSWPVSLLAGVGWSIPVADHLYLTPLFEYMRIFRAESALASTAPWRVHFGLGITLR